MEGAEASDTDKGKGKTRGKRTWTNDEEKALINALKELVVNGMRCDNGFKSGYTSLLEQKLRATMPNTDLKSKPHIYSKLHVWKKQYNSSKDAFGESGTGVFNSSHMPEMTEEKWEAGIAKDKFLKTLRGKPFPFYNDWIEIFGKDHANGQNAIGFREAVNNVLNNEGPTNPSFVFDEEPQTPSFNHSPASNSVPEHGSSSTAKSKGKKRKVPEDGNSQFVETVTSFCLESKLEMVQLNGHMGEVAKKMGIKIDGRKEERGAVYAALGKFDYLNVGTKVRVSQYLCQNPNEMDLFFSLPDEAQETMIVNILNG